mmetsp:Transcript_31120/g.47112  ORF Transcript_31120/g.47112 Transcript_31120/m.47112 type:complete len:220 (+) Transcript_31120:74-733(+)
MRILITFLLPCLHVAFRPTPGFSRLETSLNEVKVAKDCYFHNPINVEGIDKTGAIMKAGIIDLVDDEEKEAIDYDSFTDKFMEENGLSGMVRYIDEDILLSYLEAYEMQGRKDTGLIVVDVREPEEIAKTGDFSPHTINWPYASKISVDHPFLTIHDNDEWAQKYEFEYPEIYERFIILGDKETSKTAAKYLMINTYCYEVLCYEGGSEEWFKDFATLE